jgi:hypothetical protein
MRMALAQKLFWVVLSLSLYLFFFCHFFSLVCRYLSTFLSYPMMFIYVSSFVILFLSFSVFLFFVVFLSLSFGYHTISELEVLIICRMNGRQKWPNRFLNLSESHQVKWKKTVCMALSKTISRCQV